MATLTGKTIGELNILTGVTNNTLFPVEQNLITYQVSYGTLLNTITGETSLYGTGSGLYSTQRVGVSGCAIANYSVVSGGKGNIAGASGAVNNTNNYTYTGGTFNGGYGAYSPTSTLSGNGTGATFSFYFDVTNTLTNVNTIKNGSGYVNNDTLFFSGNTFPGGISPNDDVTIKINTYNKGEGSTVSGGYFNTASEYASTIGGGCANTASACYATVMGGRGNSVTDCYSLIGAGRNNTTNSDYGHNIIGGGRDNTISSYYGYSAIVGGVNNQIYDGYNSSNNGFIGGGNNNTVSGYASTVVGGRDNCSFGSCSFVGGGCGNRAYCRSTIGGGRRNTAGRLGSVDSVNIFGSYTGTGVSQGTYTVSPNINTGSGFGLTLSITFDVSGVVTNTVVVNSGNLYNTSDKVVILGDNFLGGATPLNDITYEITGTFTNSYASIIGGCGNRSIGEYSTISGGYCNTASGYISTIGGGYCNETTNDCTFIGGGYGNKTIGSSSTISGGDSNLTYGNTSTIGGGQTNTGYGCYGTISGGRNNVSGSYGTVSSYYNQTYTGGTLNGVFNSITPTSTDSLYGFGSTFNFTFNTGSLYSVEIVGGGNLYEDGNSLFFNGSVFGGTTGIDDVTFQVNTNNNNYATVAGGCRNTASAEYSTISGGYENTVSGDYSTIGGGANNTINTNSQYSTIGGGDDNTILQGDVATIGGGENNTISGGYSTISGGYYNQALNSCSTIGGGHCNTVLNLLDTIGGGGCNTTLLSGGVTGAATISGGYQNTSGNYYTFNGGGCRNVILGEFSTIGGGLQNTNYGGFVTSIIFISGDASTIPNNTYTVNPTSLVGYGSNLQISFDVSGGVVSNIIIINQGVRYENGEQVLVSGNTIGGLSPTNDLIFDLDNVVTSEFSFIGGGLFNTTIGETSTLSGGYGNRSVGTGSFLGGGFFNTSSSYSTTVSGGYGNTVSGPVSFIGGGDSNVAESALTVVAGGFLNTTLGYASSILGGRCNTASGSYSTVGGGGSSSGFNGNLATSDYAVIGGGQSNTVSGSYSSVGGGSFNTISTLYGGIMGGSGNTVSHDCSFVIGNGIASTATNTTHLNCLNLKDIPVDPAPATLPSGTVYRCSTSGNILYICI